MLPLYEITETCIGQHRISFGGNPIIAFDIKSEAVAVCAALNAAIRQGYDYGYHMGSNEAERQFHLGF